MRNRFITSVVLVVFCTIQIYAQQVLTAYRILPMQLDKIMQTSTKEIIVINIDANTQWPAKINMHVDNDALNTTVGAAIIGKEKTYLTLNRYKKKDGIVQYTGEIISHVTDAAYRIYTTPSGEVYIEPISKQKIQVED